jgi:uncharacterized membrane protein
MSTMEIVVSILIFIMIFGGILSLIKSARKFNLTEQQLTDIAKRNKQLDNEEKEREKR